MKHFIQMMMTSLAIYASSTFSDSSTSSDEISAEISSVNIQKKKKSKNLNEKEGQKYCH